MNYYDVFGVSPTATPDVINATHKALAKMYHPDINNSEDAHEKMTMLNEAHEVLSDTIKREKYDNELRRNQEQNVSSSQAAEAKRSHNAMDAQERTGKAELLRRKTEARLKAEATAQRQKAEQAQQKAEQVARKTSQAKVELDRQDVIKGLSALLMRDTLKRHKNIDVDEERYYATKVLLSMVRQDDNHLRKMAEEVERKQRIEEILTLVKELNDKEEWV